jgi:hypothetical protein
MFTTLHSQKELRNHKLMEEFSGTIELESIFPFESPNIPKGHESAEDKPERRHGKLQR